MQMLYIHPKMTSFWIMLAIVNRLFSLLNLSATKCNYQLLCDTVVSLALWAKCLAVFLLDHSKKLQYSYIYIYIFFLHLLSHNSLLFLFCIFTCSKVCAFIFYFRFLDSYSNISLNSVKSIYNNNPIVFNSVQKKILHFDLQIQVITFSLKFDINP